MVKMLFGNEPYCVWFYKDQAVKKIEMPDLNLGIFSEFTEETVDFANAAPMMGDEKLVIYQVGDLKVLDNDKFKSFIKEPPCNVLIIPEKADRRTSFFKSLPLQACDKVKSTEGLKKMIMKFLDGAGISDEAANELIERLNYFDREDVNLFSVRSVCQVLASFTDNIALEDIKALVEDNEKDNAFILIDLMLKGNIKGIRKQEAIFSRQGLSVIGALSAMLREYRIAYKLKVLNHTLSEIGVKYSKLKALTENEIMDGMEILTSVIAGIKSGRYMDADALSYACERLIEGRA